MKETAVACSSCPASIVLSSDASKLAERGGKWRGGGSGEEGGRVMLVWFCGDLRARKWGTTYDDGPLMQRMRKTRDASATFMVVSSDTVVVLEVIVWVENDCAAGESRGLMEMDKIPVKKLGGILNVEKGKILTAVVFPGPNVHCCCEKKQPIC
jgi:hypothetical protein